MGLYHNIMAYNECPSGGTVPKSMLGAPAGVTAIDSPRSPLN